LLARAHIIEKKGKRVDRMNQDISLQVKIIVLVAALIVAGLSCIIYFNIVAQEESVKREVRAGSHVIADAIYNGIIVPMSQGDSDTVRKELESLKEDLAGGEVLIFGHNKKTATFASEKSKEGTEVTAQIRSVELAGAIEGLLRAGTTPDRAYEEWIDGKPYLTMLQPISHKESCKQCHPGPEEVHGGGLLVRLSLEPMYVNMKKQVYKNVMTGVVCCLVIIILVYWAIAKLVIRPVKGVISNLSRSAQQVLISAELGSTVSQTLAKGAAEQAAGIEEAAASLEELSSMTKRNAENAGEADRHLQEANHAVEQANRDMDGLTHSMREISLAGEETSKIIKTIDEIAFQTNLLALNAAVEAARAGEAGAGFAVVADEVRNLAMRAAEAAKKTAVLIGGTVKKVTDGSALVDRTNTDFSEITGHMAKICTLVGEIVAASQEQSQGIAQITEAVAEIDKVIQGNAAGAEESAAAAEELNAQSEQMKAYVSDLATIVGGNANGADSAQHGEVLSYETLSEGTLVPPAKKNASSQFADRGITFHNNLSSIDIL